MCQRCTSGGFVCDGYTPIPPKKWEVSCLPRLAAKQNQLVRPSRGPLLVNLPGSLLIPGDPMEAYYYTHFFTNTIHDLEISESLNRIFWQKKFQSPSQNVLCIRHAVVALGAVHWQFTMGDHRRPSDIDSFTLRHYNEAISDLLHDRDSTTESASNLVTILTCCILFALLESLRGNFSEAIRHIKSGTELIANYKPSIYLPSHDFEDLAAMFHAISGQVGLFSEDRIFADVRHFLVPKKKHRGRLRDLVEAEDVMNSFDDDIGHITWDLDHDWEDDNSECIKQWETLRQRLKTWDHQFLTIVKKLMDSGEYSENVERIANLKIQHKLWELLLDGPDSSVEFECSKSPTEGSVESECREPPTAILDAAECDLLLDDLECLWSKSNRPLYGLKTDLTTALFQFYVFCIDDSVRRRIICMLRSRRRREILWDSLELADFLERDMARRACGIQKDRWPDIGPSPDDSALIVFKT